MKHVVFTDPPIVILPKYLKAIEKLTGIKVTTYSTFPIDEEELYYRGKDAEVVVIDPATQYKSILRRWPKLETIITTSVGVDQIDLVYCREHDIQVINFPGFNARAVAEMAMANLISLLRMVPSASRYVVHGGWDFQYFEGTELSGKTLGIIGSGNVGSEMVKIGKGLGMNILVHTQKPTNDKAQKLGISEFSNITFLLKNSDFVMIAIPATGETINLIGDKELHMMKKTAILINTARWQIVNLIDLAKAIYEKTIAGAALDVIDREPFNIQEADPRIQEMVNSGNVIVTPHIAFNTKESIERLSERVFEVIEKITKS